MVKGAGVKRCSRCGESKPIDAFYRATRRPDGRQCWCRACCQANYAADPAKPKVASQAWRETHREQVNAQARERHRSDPARQAASDARWYAKHSEEGRANAKAWRMAHKEQCREYYKQYRDRQRSQSPETDVTLAGWKALVSLWGGQCAYCGETPSRLSRDHVRPLTRGGLNTMSNLLPACRSCNSSKHNKLLSEWPRYQRLTQGVISA